MTYVINDQISLAQQTEDPFKSHLSKFADFLTQQGYAKQSVRSQLAIAASFSAWFGQQGVTQALLGIDHCQRFLRFRYEKHRPGRGDNAALVHLLDFLRSEAVIPAEKLSEPRLTAAEHCAQSYEQFLYEVRGLAKATVVNYVPFVLSFLKERFNTGPIELSNVCASDVVGFVQKQAPRLNQKRAKLMTTALRSFFKYTCYSNDTTMDLVAAVPVVPNWSMPSIPRGISTDQVNQLLADFDQSTAIGCRDYAILLLIARLGLRLNEVTFLELDDIDWVSGCLNVRSKGGRRHVFPLPNDVGTAIATYLKNGRPRSVCRRVFLRTKAPIEGFRSITGISSVIRHALERYGIQAPTFGAHQFRHGLATEMLHQGASLGEIGDVLGHRNPQTTTIYTKVDIEALRTLAIAWPGAVR